MTERSKCLPLNIPVSAAVTAAIVAETMKQIVCDGTLVAKYQFEGAPFRAKEIRSLISSTGTT
jgi:hypothetical protein